VIRVSAATRRICYASEVGLYRCLPTFRMTRAVPAEAGFFVLAHFEKRARVWNFGLRKHKPLFASLLPAKTRGAVPPIQENLPQISNPKPVFEVSGTKKSSLLPCRPDLGSVTGRLGVWRVSKREERRRASGLARDEGA
jgi:hypothetical protein